MENETTCRVCLRFGSAVGRTCQPLFEGQNWRPTIVDKLTTIANIKIQENDGLPSIICAECLQELDAAIQFKEKCERSYKLLLHCIREHPTSITSSSNKGIIPIDLVKKEDDTQYESVEYLDDAIESDFELKPVTDHNKTKVALELKPEFESQIENLPIIEVLTDTVPAPEPEEYVADSVAATSETNQPVIKKSRAIDLKLICNDCGGTFKSKCKLRVHWKKVHRLQSVICQFCKRTFKSVTSLQKHLKTRPLNCMLATKTRIEGVGKSRVFHCLHCNYQAPSAHWFNNHLNIHSGERPHACHLCLKSFTQLSSLNGHMETVHKIIKKQITCQYCGEIIQGRTKIQRHLNRHTNAPVQCDICKKMFKTKTTLIQHLGQHSGKKSFTCEQCAASFYTYTSLLGHIRRIHLKYKPSFKCDICDCTLTKKTILERHKVKHTIYNYQCMVCNRFFINAVDLKLHQKVHSKEKMECLQCNRIFCDIKSLRRHTKTTHKHKKNLLRDFSNKSNVRDSSDESKFEKVEVELIPLQ